MKKLIIESLLIACVLTLSCSRSSTAATTGNTPKTAEQVISTLKRATQNNRVLFAHQDYPFYGHDWLYETDRSDVKDVCGDNPAVLGCELGGLELGNLKNLDGVPFETMRLEIIKHHNKGGLVTISWHCYNPVTGGDAWDCKDNTTVASVLSGGENHDKFVGWLDKVADFLVSLKGSDQEQIPVIFRPWHEHTGSWFWWGKNQSTVEQYKALWKMTLDEFNKKGVNNLVFAYSPSNEGVQNAEQYMERYPGDDVVDIMGLDTYCGGDSRSIEGFKNSLHRLLTMIDSLAIEHGKVAALTETGSGGVKMPTWWTEVLWDGIKGHKVSYVLLWRNANRNLNGDNHFFVPFTGNPTADNFVEFYNLPETIFLSDMPLLSQKSL